MPNTPDRVRELIQASGLSQRDFGLRIGLDDSKLSKSLSGSRRFSSLDLARIAELCTVTVDWLITGEEPPLALAARTTGGSAGEAIRAARRYSTLRSDMAAIGFPQPWRPVLQDPATGNWTERGRRLATSALGAVARSGLSVQQEDLSKLVEEVFGADVAVVEVGPDFDGLAAASSDAKIILLATCHLPSRQRFTLAHELGHLLAGDNQELHLDNDVFDKVYAKEPSEIQANAFAAAFLMPEEEMRQAVGATGLTEASFAALACDWMVTPSALAYRLLNLRLIDAGACERYKAITSANAAALAGRGEELARRTVTTSSSRPPGLLVRDTYAAYEAGEATLRPYAGLLGRDVDALRRDLETGSEAPSSS
ncbi:ImmA/IrrE family metallo-endopeptidase [Streptomyces rubellomurinus]|uniref:HTH cro/C1-type domain-containing protein n=1 Tax=Streptomyces rubellomurinus (strain ATCC 31215) TaxID=359131 RepID=A0A0F2TCJ0_STRR3|nr:ImmA/IrrE family metallo-endopeptidase [Streptomyces rubellomurinus]KJS60889.1 hypothetical protein VM95_18555 [Streptomyces rubellomurinus]